MSVSTRQSAPDTAQGTTDPGVLRARQLNKEAQQRFRQRQAALVQDQESRLVAGQEEIATLKQENRVLRRSIDLQLRVLGCRDAMLAAFRDGAHLNPARQRPAGREMSTEPQALPGQQPSSPQPRDEEGAGRACLGASPKYQAHDASPGSGSGHPVLQAPCGGVAARAEAASGVEGEHCEEWEELLEGSIHTADDVRDFFDRWQARNALLVRDYLARRNAASRERLEGHMAHMMRIWEGLYQRLGLLVLAVVLELVVQRGSQAGPPDLAAAKLLRLVSSENLSKMGAMIRGLAEQVSKHASWNLQQLVEWHTKWKTSVGTLGYALAFSWGRGAAVDFPEIMRAMVEQAWAQEAGVTEFEEKTGMAGPVLCGNRAED